MILSPKTTVWGLCLFTYLITFKPSEPYLSQYLICNAATSREDCTSAKTLESCSLLSFCEFSLATRSCSIIHCSNVSLNVCGSFPYNHCSVKGTLCGDAVCYEQFTAKDVNDRIYPWAIYAYLPFLIILGPFAELYSYRIAIVGTA
jgi:hypothetical protein